MSGTVERIMSELETRLSNVQSFVSFARSDNEVFEGVDDLPLLRLRQGEDSVSLLTLTRSGGTCECVLTISIDIVTGIGTQNIETTLNNLRRNVLQSIYASNFTFFQVYDEGASEPSIDQIDGSAMGALTMNLKVHYDRPLTDPT